MTAFPYVTHALTVILTLVVFGIDLTFPLGFAPWLPYFALAVVVSRFNEPRTLLFATAFWSVAIITGPLLHSEVHQYLERIFFIRAFGAATLWIMVALLYIDVRSRRAAQDTQQRLQAIVQSALDAMIAMDHRGIVIEWNPQAEIIFGYGREEAVGRRLADLIIPERYREAHAKGMHRFLTTGEDKILRRRIEITAVRTTGEEFPVELSVIPLHVGKQVLFSSFIRDVSEQKRAMEQLKESTGFIESVLEHLPNMVFVKDAKDLRFVRFNKAGEELLGIPRSELIGKSDYDFFPKSEAEFFTTKDRETLSSGHLTDIPEEVIQTKTKGSRILHTKKIPIADASGNARYLLGISEDITEIRKAMEDQRASEERFQLAVRGSSDGIWDWNIATDKAYFSPRYRELLGYSEQEYPDLVSSFWSHLHPDDHQWLSAAMKSHLERRQPFDVECRFRAKSGSYRWFRIRGQAMWTETGAPARMAGSLTDITKAKDAEAAFIRSRLEVQMASRAKSDFLANMSHEMRTPLNAITGIADFLEQTSLSEEQLALVRRCAKAGDSLLRMIEDLLHAAKAESGTLELRATPITIERIVTDSTELLAAEAREKGLSLQSELGAHLPQQVYGDGHRLQQVLVNLIRNAVRYTVRGSITVRAALASLTDDEAEILFRVTDTGVGIPKGEEERIFERFTQIRSSMIRESSGVGLGLSICKQYVVAMGGRIWVDRNPGGGSIFSFTVPLKTKLEDPAAEFPSPPEALYHTAGSQPADAPAAIGMRILLAEDFHESREVMRLFLRNTPHQLDCAATGAEAVALFKSKPFDLVLMDLNMPDMDGYMATCLIRAWEAEQGRPQTPVIALSANGLSEARQESLAAGCNDFLTKPIKSDTVLKAIQRYAEQSAAQEQAPAAIPADSVPDELAELKSTFIRNRSRDVSALEQAVAKKDFEIIRTIGHRIKGLAGSYGLDEIGAIGGAIEEAALGQNVDDVVAQIATLAATLRQLGPAGSDGTGQTRHAA